MEVDKVLPAYKLMRDLGSSDFRARFGEYPFFQDDKEITPLQAADLHAGWVRKSYEAIIRGELLPKPPWGEEKERLINKIEHVWTPEWAAAARQVIAGGPRTYPRIIPHLPHGERSDVEAKLKTPFILLNDPF
jgi:hypothetical protein